ncbi:hypothetical protein SISSUDRAFT_1067594 [Sistotremastrum suecicum HHB10207 ss-3]|uniref:HAT C-terminal dimerisation domain-containing protein n=1 Tax=Sistotremastrum suecicum HHB10207 ss-3 TaxID=1314776 RepID=A0A165WY69_9AGAM|nr:hypothetical protein SISSUDRAFT_1067594 [Sistotremastrum suecicum HHB10207 ss-3]
MSHTGENLAIEMVKVMDNYGLSEKWLACAGDNASNNDTMTDHIPELVPSHGGQTTRIRCILHVINLVAQAFFRPFESAADVETPKTRTKTRAKAAKKTSNNRKRGAAKQNSQRAPKKRRTLLPDRFEGEEMELDENTHPTTTIPTPTTTTTTTTTASNESDEDSDSSEDEDSSDDGFGLEEVPLTREEAESAALAEDGITDANNVATYRQLVEAAGVSDEDVAAAAEMGGAAVQEQAAEVEKINNKTIKKLGPLSAEEKKTGVFMFKKVKAFATLMKKSDTKSTHLKDCCKHTDTKILKPVTAVKTRWNTIGDAIARHVVLKQAIIRLTTHAKYEKLKLERLIMKTKEWLLAEEVGPYSKVLKDCTVSLSVKNQPLVHQVIPVIDYLTEKFAAAADDDSGQTSLIIRHGAVNGISVLNTYYSKTDDSVMYRVAMNLHPKYKLEYFKAKKWKKKWIREAEKIVREIWARDYLPKVVVKKAVQQPQAPYEFNIGDYAHLTSTVAVPDPITRYLAEPVVNIADPLAYWDGQLKAGLWEYQFVKMAKDYLSAPASSVDVERAFSLSGRIVSPLRSSLSDKHIRMCVLLNSWFTIPGLISEEEFEQTLVEGWRREGKGTGRGNGNGKGKEKENEKTKAKEKGKAKDDGKGKGPKAKPKPKPRGKGKSLDSTLEDDESSAVSGSESDS